MSNNRIIVYSSHLSYDGSIRKRAICTDDPIPKGYYLTEEEALQVIRERQTRLKEERRNSLPEAERLLAKVESEIKNVLKKYNTELYFDYDGDSQGIDNETINISVKVNGHEYSKQLNLY